MDSLPYFRISQDQINKVGNAAIYISKKIGLLPKTKFLKLLYILDEVSIKKHGLPFFNLRYKVWKLGPVSEDLFVDLSDGMAFMAPYVEKQNDDYGNTYIKAKAEFDDSEFSDIDMETMDVVISKFGNKTATELVKYTHRDNSPWKKTAIEKSVLDLLEGGQVNNTEHVIDMGMVVEHNEFKKQIYLNYIESH